MLSGTAGEVGVGVSFDWSSGGVGWLAPGSLDVPDDASDGDAGDGGVEGGGWA
ncbi:MAG TPA: hypothetical protein VF516_19040 [Kofleriaceae bacterium]